MLNNTIVLGIDLGTTNSVIAYNINENEVEVLRDAAGRGLYPSVVAYTGDKIHTGYAALLFDHQVTVFSAKRLIGRKWNDKICMQFHHNVESGPNGHAYINVSGKWVTPEQVMQDLLLALKRRSESLLHCQCYNVVITVPARFDDKSRNIIRDAAKSVGFKVLRIINEPTAAAIGYGIHNQHNGIYGVYDFGGGTFDFSLLSIGKNTYHVLATGGSLEIGGDDLDRLMMDLLKTHDTKIARSLKEQLSFDESVTHNGMLITRKQFEDRASNIIQKTIDIINHVLDESAILMDSMVGILLVGGGTKLPLVKTILSQSFPNAILHDNHNPNEIVAIGAAHHANMIINNKKHLLLDVIPLSIGVEVMGGSIDVIFPRQTPLPASTSRTYTTAQSGQTAIHFNVVQGERHLAKNCISLGVFEVNNITPLGKNVARIKVDFHVDINGILNISAYESGKNIKHHLKIDTNHTSNKNNTSSEVDDLDEWQFQQEKYYLEDLEDEVSNLIRVKKSKIDPNVKYRIENLFQKAKAICEINKLDQLRALRNEIDAECIKLIVQE